MKYKYITVLACAMLLLAGMADAKPDDYIQNIEIEESGIVFNQQEFPRAAYLGVTLKNRGDRKVSFLAFEIKYYDEETYLIKKAVIKYKLSEIMEGGETRKYKIRLKGDIINLTNAEYPYAQSNEVDSYDLNIINAKFLK